MAIALRPNGDLPRRDAELVSVRVDYHEPLEATGLVVLHAGPAEFEYPVFCIAEILELQVWMNRGLRLSATPDRTKTR